MIIFCTLGVFTEAYAQEKITVSGKITDADNQAPIMYANIAFPELAIGTTSNEKGEFIIHAVPVGTYTFSVTYIGYKEYSISVTLKQSVALNIKLQQQSLGLKEVTVTAEQSTSGTTSSKIKSDAINHVQASSLKDVMQLVPGNLLLNPNLGEPGKLSIREIDSNGMVDVNSALGTAVIVDDIPMTNDGNMQKAMETGSSMTTYSGSGLDIRSISVDNIESITVDVGIPSAEHGNLTSGAVRIKTKSGGSPFNVKVKADPKTKQAFISKGFLLDNDKGVINMDMDVAHSYADIFKKTNLFDRYNLSTKYSQTFFREKNPLNIEGKLSFSYNIDGNEWDPDMIIEEEAYSKETGIMGKLSASWMLDKSFLSSLSLDISYSMDWQTGFEKTLESSSSGPSFYSTAITNGEYQIYFTPSSYYSEVTYDGNPYNFYAKLKGTLFKKTGVFTHSGLFGAEWRTTGNTGDGRLYDTTRPANGLGTRPRPFTDIPALNQLSLFAEDKITTDIGSTGLEMTLGLRMDNIQPTSPFTTDGSIAVDPRINVKYNILNRKNNELFKDFSLRLGYGKTTKAPTLIHLYPDREYNDVISFSYYPDLVVSTTNVVDTRNYDLKPAKSTKYEVGIDFQIGHIKTRLTGFYEEHKDGFVNDRVFYPMNYRYYNVLAAGLNPYYVPNDGVYYNDANGNAVKVGYENAVKFSDYEQYRNADVRIKRGMEYTIDFGKIKALQTSFMVTGAWLQTESYTEDAPYWETVKYTSYTGGVSKDESFVVKFQDEYGYGTVFERLNTNISIINHIPKLKMIVSLTTQIVWYEKDWRKIYSDDKFYSLSELRNYLGNASLFSSEQEETYYYQLPVSYKMYDNIEHVYTPGDFAQSLHQLAIDKELKYRFGEKVLPTLFLCNINISKDITKRIKLAFYANNFLNIRPRHLNEREGSYVRRNQEPFFGADLTFQF
ncbi:MAG: hypothetical protein A2W89_12350 [Bacteroidetes bacterium GWE2_42_39]|nr:MAG: hypothetical protein A2W89_12350 [Bacteroidetes bacterium GWE2_42_39]